MALPNNTKTQYHLYLESEFIKNLSAFNSMSDSLSPALIQEYLSLGKTVSKHTLNLIEMGTDFDLKEDSVDLFIDGEAYNVSISLLNEKFGELYVRNFFEKNSPNIVLANNVDNSMINAMKSLMNILSISGNSEKEAKNVSGVSKPKDAVSSILENIMDIQRTVIALEKEKDDALSEKEYYCNQFQKIDEDNQRLTSLVEQKDISPEDYAILQRSKALIEKNKELNDNIEVLKREIKNKENSCTEHLNKITAMEKSYHDLEETLKNNEKASAVQKENLARYKEDLDKEKNRSENQSAEIRKLNSVIENKSGEIKKIAKEIQAVSMENKDFKDKINSLIKEKNSIEEKLKILSEEKNSLKNDHEKLIKDIREEHYEQLKIKEDLINENNNELARKNEQIRYLNQKNQDLLDKLGSSRIDERKLQEAKILKDKVNDLKKLAFFDAKTEINNANAFNRDFADADKDKIIVAMCGVRELKSINDNHGRETGDNVIKCVSDEIKAKFKNCQVYRLIGDQFAIISDNKTLNQIKGDLADLQMSLNAMSIKISYAACAGCDAENKRDLIRQIEKDMLQMKKQDVPENMMANYDDLKKAASPEVIVEEEDTNNPEYLSEEEMLAQFINS